MCYLRERVTIISYMVIVINGQQWYPATVTDQTNTFDTKTPSSLIDDLKDIPVYLPLFESNDESKPFNKSKWQFSQRHNQQPTRSYPTGLQEKALDTTIRYQSEPSFEKDDSNNTLPSRPKRKALKRCPSVQPIQKKRRNLNQSRKGKFLEVFEVVQFEHVTCTSSSGLEGTCLHEYDCQSAGGTTMGSCADGYATCCVIQLICDGRSSSPNGWITNPDFPTPSSERISCTITLDKSSPDVHQIRIGFLIFELLSPTSGSCEDDQFVISGQNTNNIIPILCGINTGHHVYVEVGDVEGPVYISIQTVTPEKRLYAIKVTQVSKSDDIAAPKGCLQYYKDENGYLESFNYRETSDIGIPRYPSYLNNLNYAICIERSATSCSITYTNAGQLEIPNYDTDGLPVIPPKQAGVEIFNCPSDWLLISAIRLCGERLNDGSVLEDFSLDAPVTDNGAGPLVMWFRSDGGYVGRGFKLYYKQNPCAVST